MRTLLVLVAILTIPCWWIGREVSEYHSEQSALSRILEINPKAGVRHQNETPTWIAAWGIQPVWMDRVMRVDAHGVNTRTMPYEEFPQSQVDFGDKELKIIKDDLRRFRSLREIYFSVTKLSDESVELFGDMDYLEVLNLQETNVATEGAEKLRELLPTTDVQHFPRRSR